ncbi:MAG: DUF924 family protein [Comamonadaceae bacterium]|nr:MAG: DUF924 family protein [Comamonadaceae bacterium]
MNAEDVVDFWRTAGPQKWFRKDAHFDAEFRDRFIDAHEAAWRGQLKKWEEHPQGALALLILLDQFPRNAFRGSPRMFATDEQALAIARKAIDRGLDQETIEPLRAFFYLPFMHSECLADQEASVRMNAELGEDSQKFAVLHRDIIARFGRFPHRNILLGRKTTAEEQAFLDEGGFSG